MCDSVPIFGDHPIYSLEPRRGLMLDAFSLETDRTGQFWAAFLSDSYKRLYFPSLFRLKLPGHLSEFDKSHSLW
jgi:hypothetical protein